MFWVDSLVPKMHTLTEKQRLMIISLSNTHSYRQISRVVGNVSYGGVRKVIQRFRNEGTIQRKVGSGKTRMTSTRADRMIVKQVILNPKTHAREIKERMEELGINVSVATIKRRLNEKDFHGRKARKVPQISKKNAKLRLAFAKKYRNKTIRFWKQVLFSDESSFTYISKRSQSVWRRAGQEYDEGMTTATQKHQSKIMVWGCFSHNGQGSLEIINGIMDSKAYQGILGRNLIQSAGKLRMGNKFIFQHDNDPKHKSKSTQAHLIEKEIKVLDHPPQSPDLNPIEHLWDALDRLMPLKERTTKVKFIEALHKAWNSIDLEVMQKLIQSMPRRLEEVIRQKGYATRY